MKKHLISILFLIMTLALMLSLCACGNDDSEVIEEGTKGISCQHQWRLLSEKTPTCSESGVRNLECKLCSEKKSATLEPLACNYSCTFEWVNGDHDVRARFVCPDNSEHNYLKPAIKKIVKQVKGNCQEKTKTQISVEASHKGVYFNELFVFEGRLGDHVYSYTATAHGNTCYDGYTVTGDCIYCDATTEKTYYTHDDRFELLESYDLSEYGFCGGLANRYSCFCGMHERVEIYPYCDNFVESDFESRYDVVNGIAYNSKMARCTMCQLGIKYESETVDKEAIEPYYLKTTLLNDEKEFATFVQIFHENKGHNVEQTRELAGQGCNDGYFDVVSCKECSYIDKIYQAKTLHRRDNKVIDLSEYCGCNETITVLGPCPCGEYIRYYLDDTDIHKDHEYEEVDPSELIPEEFTVEDPFGFDSRYIAYKFNCGLVYFNGRCYAKDFDHYVYELIIIKLDDLIIFERIPEIIGNDLPDGIFDDMENNKW